MVDIMFSVDDWASPSLKEAPYWREGMSPEEYDEERIYYYKHFATLEERINYKPMWKQKLEEEQ